MAHDNNKKSGVFSALLESVERRSAPRNMQEAVFSCESWDWKPDESWEFITESKMTALGISDKYAGDCSDLD